MRKRKPLIYAATGSDGARVWIVEWPWVIGFNGDDEVLGYDTWPEAMAATQRGYGLGGDAWLTMDAGRHYFSEEERWSIR